MIDRLGIYYPDGYLSINTSGGEGLAWSSTDPFDGNVHSYGTGGYTFARMAVYATGTAGNASTQIHMFYSNPDANETNNTSAWDADFLAVYHMNDWNSSIIADSTSYGYNGLKKGAGEPLEVDGNFGGDKAQSFDGTDDYIGLGFNLTAASTLESVVKWGNVSQAGTIFSTYDTDARNLVLLESTGTALHSGVVYDNASADLSISWVYGGNLTNNVWYYLSAAQSSSYSWLYLNAAMKNASGASFTLVDVESPDVIGNDYSLTVPFKGNVSELRVSSVRRSVAWDKATYYSLMLPTSFCYVIEHTSAPVYTLTYLADTGGSLAGDIFQEVTYGGDGVPVEAIADTGYRFYIWDDMSVANPRTDTFVTANKIVTASFQTISISAVDPWVYVPPGLYTSPEGARSGVPGSNYLGPAPNSSNFFGGDESMEGLPMYSLFLSAANSMEISVRLLYLFAVIITCVGLGVGAWIATGNAIVGLGTVFVLMGAAVSAGVIGVYVLILYIIMSLGYLLAARGM